MKNSDLLELLQDIWEEDGMFDYIRVHYVEQRNIDIIEVQKLIKFGLNRDIFEIYECKKGNKVLILEDFKKIKLNDSLKLIDNQESWKQNIMFYEVVFINKKRWFNDLFVKKEIPEAFINFNKILDM